MPKVLNLLGQKFGRLLVLSKNPIRTSRRAVIWFCLCECGDKVEVKGDRLRNGTTKSCGCLKRDMLSQRMKKHGLKGTATYNSWCAMKKRCDNPKHKYWKYYGGRGITYCKEWAKFENFAKDMGLRPEKTSLDRINNNGNYQPDNCRWADIKTQNNNKTKNRPLRAA